MLRIAREEPRCAFETIDVAGIKVFPVDDFHFAKRSECGEYPEAAATETSRRRGRRWAVRTPVPETG